MWYRRLAKRRQIYAFQLPVERKSTGRELPFLYY